jgi:hypothetical protein
MFLLPDGQDVKTRSCNAENSEKRFEEKLQTSNQVKRRYIYLIDSTSICLCTTIFENSTLITKGSGYTLGKVEKGHKSTNKSSGTKLLLYFFPVS